MGLRWALAPLLAVLAHAQVDGPFQCSNSSSAAYNATFTSLGCYNDSSVSILEAAKLSTIAMTPSYCASWCGERGYAYGGINFGTQCFCGNEPNFSNANKIDESRCQPCVTEPESKCGSDMCKLSNGNGTAIDS
jgi:beta-D-xylosidase 4